MQCSLMRRSTSSAFTCLFCQTKATSRVETRRRVGAAAHQQYRPIHDSSSNCIGSFAPRPKADTLFAPSKHDEPIPQHPLGPHLRPTTAPKPTLDIKHIAQSPGLYAQNAIDRSYAHLQDNAFIISDLVRRRAHLQQSARTLRERNNEVQRQIEIHQIEDKQQRRKHSANRKLQELLAEAKELKGKLEGVRKEEDHIAKGLEDLALPLPALTSNFTPVGKNAEPEVLKTVIADKESGNLRGTSHVDIGTELGILDFAAAATTTGWGWYYLISEGAMLEQALIQHTMSLLQQRGWLLVSPPSITYGHIATACGFQPRDQNGEQQIYTLAPAEKTSPTPETAKERENTRRKASLVLAGTSEIPLAALHAGKTLTTSDLPLKTAAVSRCYRAEAGARGVDTKGLYRVHEFTKVEMFAWVLPNKNDNDSASSSSNDGFFAPDPQQSSQPSKSKNSVPETPAEIIFDEMVSLQQAILKALDLPYRLLEMPSTDLGASASRKRDIEVFFPSRRHRDGGWGEVTSCSICDDYQTRRLGTRVKLDGLQSADSNGGFGSGKESATAFPYTINGTALAAPRVLAALLENGWDEATRKVRIPECLRMYMGGKEFIEKGTRS